VRRPRYARHGAGLALAFTLSLLCSSFLLILFALASFVASVYAAEAVYLWRRGDPHSSPLVLVGFGVALFFLLFAFFYPRRLRRPG
jgi:hypothetical protein